ncbi:hypothetical protein CYMTET_6806 [Cymbomonas tetramitiformis]|uniref:Uncharacterized protein n=1 Tax=Cymbomonas tetramitiformis TaxID=36881 RepID=A0AAE0GWQ4_9CHLO|nr:hypothetical protein CYMTET_6806 [Cymbomonas tetramitiformis]
MSSAVNSNFLMQSASAYCVRSLNSQQKPWDEVRKPKSCFVSRRPGVSALQTGIFLTASTPPALATIGDGSLTGYGPLDIFAYMNCVLLLGLLLVPSVFRDNLKEDSDSKIFSEKYNNNEKDQ